MKTGTWKTATGDASPWWIAIGLLLFATMALGGCARAALDTRGFPAVTSGAVEAPFDTTWQATKAVLRERDWDIYTRDKRGVFVAHTDMKRRHLVKPTRTKYTIILEPTDDTSTKVTVECVRQVYGVSLLTYPGWHDRKTMDDSGAVALLEALQTSVPDA